MAKKIFDDIKSDIKREMREEKWPYFIPFFIFGGLILLMYVFALTGWTFYGKSVHDAKNYWLLIGLALQAIGIGIIIYGANSEKGIKPIHWVIGGALFFIGFAAFTGFNFKYA